MNFCSVFFTILMHASRCSLWSALLANFERHCHSIGFHLVRYIVFLSRNRLCIFNPLQLLDTQKESFTSQLSAMTEALSISLNHVCSAVFGLEWKTPSLLFEVRGFPLEGAAHLQGVIISVPPSLKSPSHGLWA